MKVFFRQSGGFAGLLRGAELDTESLGDADARTLRALVEQSGILATASERSATGRDAGEFEITIEDGARQRHVRLDDITTPESAWPLLEFLMARSSPRPPR
jgi:hypothetical protein